MEAGIAGEIGRLHGTLKQLSKRFGLNTEEASDLVQDTILKALLYKEKFTENRNLQGWLFTIMRNTFINNYRRGSRQRLLQVSARELYFLNVEDHHTFNSPERKYEWTDLWKSIEALKDELLIPFKLHTSGYKYHEIAEQLKIPIGTVKNRIFLARKEIQKKLT